MSTMAPSHISIDEQGVARIAGTRMKVSFLIEARRTGASSAEMLHESFPYLTLAQIHSALSYYHDHAQQIEAEIEAGRQCAEAALAAAEATPEAKARREKLRAKLRDAGLRP